MKKFLVGALAALTLFVTSSAQAADAFYMPSYGVNDTAQYQALDTGPFNDMRTLLTFKNGNGPKLIADPTYFFLGTDKLTDLLDDKLDAVDNHDFSGAYSDLTGKPTLFSGVYSDLTGKPTLFSGAYSDLTGKPSTFPPSSHTHAESDITNLVTDLGNKVDKVSGKGLSTEDYTSTEKTKLAGIATGATANDTDANLKNRANHTGTQAISTVSGLQTALDSKATVWDGTIARTNPVVVFKAATVSGGVAVMHITTDGTSGGSAICPNGPILASVNPIVNDSTAAYQMSWAWSNSNKTLTITTNKLTTANILTGILGQTSGNGSTVNVAVACY